MIRLFLLSVFTTAVFASVNIDRERIELLPYCEYTTLSKSGDSIDALDDLDKSAWKRSDSRSLSLGFSNDTTLWIRCSLKNALDKSVMRVLETDNPRTEYVTLYADGEKTVSGGVYRGTSLDTVNPYFKLHWSPGETKTLYLAFRSPNFSLNATPILWHPSSYLKHEKMRNLMIGLFFGAMGALLLYNFFIFLFTKDITYFWYCGYLFTLIFHQLYYTKIIELYIPHNAEVIPVVFNTLVILLTLFIAYFTRSFLNTGKNMPILDTVLKYLPFYALLVLFSSSLETSLLIVLPVVPVFIVTALRALQLGLRQARYFAAGWIAVCLSWFIMALINFGLFPSPPGYNFIPQIGFLFEALIFAIGLADRINTLKAEKEAADKELIRFHERQQEELQARVKERTLELTKALKEKNLLLKEVHHRVKNNLQMIVSLMQLQSSKADKKSTKEILQNAQSRIASIGALHEILYRKGSVHDVDTEHYFKQIVSQLRSAAPDSQKLEVEFDIEADLDPDRAIYCGLILNELVTNGIKHAFDTNEGTIRIQLKREKDIYRLVVSDNGTGFKNGDKNSESVGLALVKALATQQLKGSYTIESDRSGTKQTITFPA